VVLQLLRFLVLVSLFVSPLVLEGQTFEENATVLVSVFNDSGVDDATVLAAEKMTSQIYEQASLLIVWRNCPSQAEAKRHGCLQTVDNRHLVLHIEHDPRTLGSDVYGVAFLDEDGSGSYCDVFYDRIAALHQRGNASEAKILAIVAAHELGHLLLGSHAHSPIGIMRPQLQANDFWRPELGATAFTPQQTQRISDRLTGIKAQTIRNRRGQVCELSQPGAPMSSTC
jgi:hypothetical protein